MSLVVNPKNKKEEKIIIAIMKSLEISFHTEEEEDAALYNAMQAGRKSDLLSERQKASFLRKLRPDR